MVLELSTHELASSKGVIKVNKEICIGCRTCEVTCSLVHEGLINPELARIFVIRNPLMGPDFTPLTCHQCVEPLCLISCPVGAIKLDIEAGTYARVIDEDACIGCKTCIDACPFDPPRVRFSEEKLKAIKCDLCGGEPKCVDNCPVGALSYITDEEGVKTGYPVEEGGKI